MKYTKMLVTSIILFGVAFGLGTILTRSQSLANTRVWISTLRPAFQSVKAASMIPFTVQFEEKIGLTKENLILSRSIVFAQKEDGSSVSVERQNSMKEQFLFSRRTIRFANDILVETEEEMKLATLMRLPGSYQSRLMNAFRPDKNCGESLDGKSARIIQADGSLLGYPVYRSTQEASRFKATSWYSPQLACLELARTLEFKDSDGKVTDLSILQPISIQIGKVDDSLFYVDPSFTDVAPSERTSRFEAQAQRPVDHKLMQTLQRIDTTYYKNRVAIGELTK